MSDLKKLRVVPMGALLFWSPCCSLCMSCLANDVPDEIECPTCGTMFELEQPEDLD